MSLLLNGAKTVTIAGTTMQCVEIYTGEAYTMPFNFTDSTGNAVNCNGWTLGTSAKFYTADTVSYNSSNTVVTIGNLTLDTPQPSTGAGTYSANLTATFTSANTGVEFKDLGIVVVDEQHRFGVEQRDALRNKAIHPPHLLVMTATPIPRTVAMTIFGDLDVSTLRTLPSGRAPIQTFLIPTLEKPHYLTRAWDRIAEEVSKGHQAYVVAPRISENAAEEEIEGIDRLSQADQELARELSQASKVSTNLDGKSLDGKDEASELSKIPLTSVEELAPRLALGPLKGLKVAPLHGRLAADEKEATMTAFSNGEIDVLVATTVIEVGVDVPNASTMVVMDADRFGVSQLHQLRGRVGRGGVPGLCLLVTNAEYETPAMARLEAVAGTLDGFELARIDLEQRSEGDVLGSAQSGTRSHLRLLRVLRDEDLIERAREAAITLIDADPELIRSPQLAVEVNSLMAQEQASFVDKG